MSGNLWQVIWWQGVLLMGAAFVLWWTCVRQDREPKPKKSDAAGTLYSDLAHCICGEPLSEWTKSKLDDLMVCHACKTVSPWRMHLDYQNFKRRCEARDRIAGSMGK